MGFNSEHPAPYSEREKASLREDIRRHEVNIAQHMKAILDIKRALGDDDGSGHEWGESPGA